MLQDTIAAFARRMGMTGFVPSAGGLAAFDIDGVGRLFVEPSDDMLLVYLARAVPAHETHLPRRLLDLSHYRHAWPLPLQGGMHGGQAVVLTRLDGRTATAVDVENAAVLLAGVLDRATAPGEGA
ncbi:type III secretion chaperone SycN [Nitratidesulfovibrio vulgaris]|uniref:type III secretion chaperone SycN n=1 Tax=Nitratidesulfovibrio vulgaris TaxID=881 RepID=UPI002300D087|nr:type III secretion chaperone SycN [Nitratidesulfovibrio vulgaris]WCB48221.1 type III secretion chaperone SycN [Nitratidesulfovibrio vulgaris]